MRVAGTRKTEEWRKKVEEERKKSLGGPAGTPPLQIADLSPLPVQNMMEGE